VFAFLLAVVAIPAGLVGLALHYHRERQRQEAEEDLPGPRIHREASCRIELALVDRLARTLKALRQRAEEKHWETDWPQFEQHHRAGSDALQRGDLPGAYREYCLALLPLTRALHKHRHKEESFQPVWDKTH
jgi:hypothetical protein